MDELSRVIRDLVRDEVERQMVAVRDELQGDIARLRPSGRMTIQQAAQTAQVHVDTMRKACAAGDIRASQRVAGGRWSIREEDLEAWIIDRA